MNKIIITLLLVFLFSFTFSPAQSISRNSASLPTVSAPIAELTEAMGWFKNSAGQWYNSPNQILSEPALDFLDLYTKHQPYGKSHLQDFESIQLRETTVNNQKFLVFYIHHWEGNYRYPNIYRDWEESRKLVTCVFNSDELTKFNALLYNTNTANRVVIDCVYGSTSGGSFIKNSIAELEQKALEDIYKQSNNNHIHNLESLIFDIFPVMDSDNHLMRFLWEEGMMLSTIDISTLEGITVDYYRSFDPLIFDQQYFETDFNSFLSLTENPDSPMPLNESQETSTDSNEVIIYKIQLGDSLSKIASQYNTTVEEIIKNNNIDDPSLIQVGQEIVINK